VYSQALCARLVDCTILEEVLKTGTMEDLLNLSMLICAAAGSVAFSVLAAYGILRFGFAMMRPQPRPAAAGASRQVVRAS